MLIVELAMLYEGIVSFKNMAAFYSISCFAGWSVWRGIRWSVCAENQVVSFSEISTNGLIGFVLFANVNTVSGSGSLFTSWHPAGGTGLRIKMNKASGTNIGVDYGFSKGYNTLMLNLGEAF